MTQRRSVEWLMSSEDAPDFDQVMAELVNRPAWHRQAACGGVDPDLFFPHRSRATRLALAYCETCLVGTECLTTALDRGQTATGIWGETTGRERRGLRRSVA